MEDAAMAELSGGRAYIEIETVAIREWKGCWMGGKNILNFSAPSGGYIITFHRGLDHMYKVEHYNTIEEIQKKYPQYIWMSPDPRDPSDIVLVGI